MEILTPDELIVEKKKSIQEDVEELCRDCMLKLLAEFGPDTDYVVLTTDHSTLVVEEVAKLFREKSWQVDIDYSKSDIYGDIALKFSKATKEESDEDNNSMA